MIGFVSLVGAGPGDPDLLTVRAMRRLSEADVVFHDALVPAEIVALARGSHRVDVGKRAGRKAVSQEAINRLLVRTALRGKKTVRLKCGDPFVFGRGGEEALALSEAGVPFEVIPGVSSAIAAPALSGIPVTHRGTSSGFAVLSGHSEPAYRPILEGIAPGSITLVVLMGLATRGALARFLISRGWASRTPAAILLGASTPDAASWFGTLGELGEASLPAGGAAGVLCIGEVVSIAGAIARASHGARLHSSGRSA